MSSRWLLSSLALLLCSPALAEDGVTVRVRCTEECRAVLDGKWGRRVNGFTWEFQGIPPGLRRLEVTGLLSRPLVSGFAEIPPGSEASVIITANRRIVVERSNTGTPEAPSSRDKSVAIIRCTEECVVRLDGRGGVRWDKWTWEFKDVEPGRHRVEAAGLLDRKLFVAYVEVPAGSEATFHGDSRGHVTLTERKELRAARENEASRIHVRCEKSCTVSLDGTRRGSTDTSGLVIQDVKPGPHELEVRFPVGRRMRRTTLNVSAAHEVFLTVSEDSGFQVTNAKPLGGE
jgi:hypothetical protein